MKLTERAAWITLVAAIGTWSFSNRNKPSTGEGAPGPEPRASPRHLERQPAIRETSAREADGRETSTPPGGIRSRSTSALRIQDPIARMAGFSRILAACDDRSLDQVLATMEEMKAGGVPLPAEEALLRFRAGQLRGATLFEGRPGSAADLAALDELKQQYPGWIHADPQAAGRWLDGLPAGKFRDQMAVAYIAARTHDDPLGSLRLAASLHPSKQEEAGRAAAGATRVAEAPLLMKALGTGDTGGNNRYLEAMFVSLAGKAAGSGDPAADAWIGEHLDQPYAGAGTLARISAAKARTDPGRALEWALAMESRRPDLLGHGRMVAETIRSMTLQGLDSAEAWANSRDDAPALLDLIGQRREKLQDRARERNEYDRDD